MNRRQALQKALLGTGLTVSIPTWAIGWQPNQFSAAQSNLENKILEAAIEAIIPEGTVPGAKNLGVANFVNTMLSDCYAKVDQDKFYMGLAVLQKSVNDTTQKSFELQSIAERQNHLRVISESDNENAQFFYKTLRSLTIQGYTSSEYIMTKIYGYEMAPGRYDGCVVG